MNSSPKNIIIAGSGRSGTTWITDVLSSCEGCISVYEPLKRSSVPQVPGTDGLPEHPGTYLRPGDPQQDWTKFFRQVFDGAVSNCWTRRDFNRVPKWTRRIPIAERASYHLAKRLYQWQERRSGCRVVKLVRGNLLLAWLVRNFNVPVAFVIRHPCAVVASRIRLGWNLDVSGIVAQDTLMNDYLAPFHELILTAKSPVEKAAVIWCVENLIPLSQFPLANVTPYVYEQIVAGPTEAFNAMFEAFQLRPSGETLRTIGDKANGFPSHFGRNSRSWHAGLGEADGSRVLDLCYEFGIELYGRESLNILEIASQTIHRRIEQVHSEVLDAESKSSIP